MNKEEVLSKSQKENIYGDEREKKIRIKRDAFSVWGIIILGIIIMAIKTVQGESPADIISLFYCMSGLALVYEGVKLDGKIRLAVGVVMLLLSAYSFYRFCIGIF